MISLSQSLEPSPCEAFVAQFAALNLTFPQLNHEKLRFYPVVDSLNWVQRLARCGAKTIQLRIKNQPRSAILSQARAAQEICNDYGVQFFLNDYWDIALELGLFGVHLGFEDLQEAFLVELSKHKMYVGLSTHSAFELSTALALSPSYVALGPIFPTTLKTMRFAPQGLERIGLWRRWMPDHVPLVAIGGISLETASLCYGQGAQSVAVVSDVVQHPFPEERVRAYLSR
jgi:thiamine-phosphate pyrophosphorylase